MAETYLGVARQHSLTGITAKRFVSYMRKRWPDDEETKSIVGYAGEWAERFKHKMEYGTSDSTGKAVLKEMDASERQQPK